MRKQGKGINNIENKISIREYCDFVIQNHNIPFHDLKKKLFIIKTISIQTSSFFNVFFTLFHLLSFLVIKMDGTDFPSHPWF